MKVILETYLMKVILETYLMKVILETYLMKVILETYLIKVILESRFHYYHWVDISTGWLLVSEGIIRQVVSASALTWSISYTGIYLWYLHFLNNVTY
jgi:hypothetical protein